MPLVDDQDGGAAAFGGLSGEDVVGLGGEGGGAVGGPAAQGGDDVVVDAAHAGGGVADVDDGVAGGIERGERGADRDGLADADLAGEDTECFLGDGPGDAGGGPVAGGVARSEEHTSELQSPCNLVCRLLLEKKKKTQIQYINSKKKKKLTINR